MEITVRKDMEFIRYIDWADLHCPCGESLSGRFCSEEKWDKFVDNHRYHTSGYAFQKCGSDWSKVYTSIPADNRFKF